MSLFRLALLLALGALSACSSSSSGAPTSTSDTGVGDSASTKYVTCDQGQGDCTCVGTTTPPSTPPQACNTSSFSVGGVCCAKAGYPDKDISTCQCVSWSCWESASVCRCDEVQNGTQTACQNAWAHCCAHVLSDGSTLGCSCSNFACQSGDVEVSSCSIGSATCRDTETKVASCTP